MGWLYVDDGFPEHHKAVQAGGDAGWLWLCAYAYVNRNDSGGYIPKALVPRLSDRKNPRRLAAKLVEVGLWEDKGDAFYMHDYDIWNAKQMARRAAGRKAAEARWSHNDRNADDMPTHMRSHDNRNAGAMPSPQSLSLSPSLSGSDLVQWPSDRRVPGAVETEMEIEKAGALTHRIVQLFVAAGVEKPQIKPVMDLVQWALTHLDANLVDEAVGYVEGRDSKPRTVKYLAKTFRSWGAQRGVEMPEFGS